MRKKLSLLFSLTLVIFILVGCNGNNKTSPAQAKVNSSKNTFDETKVANGIKQFNLVPRESKLLTERMKTIGANYDDYKYIVSNDASYYYFPSVKKEDIANSENVVNILGYFSLLNQHSFMYGAGTYDNKKNDYGTAARMRDFLGKGTVEGKEVYAEGDYLAYASNLNSGERTHSIDAYKVSLYQIDDTNIKEIGEIKKSSDGKEKVSWLQDNLININTYPINMERGKEYYFDVWLNEPNRSYNYICATGFMNLKIDENYFANCLEIKKYIISGGNIFFQTSYYARDTGFVYGESESVFINQEKKEIILYPKTNEYFINGGKGEWGGITLKITSFVSDQKQSNPSTEIKDTSGNKITKEAGLQIAKSKAKVEANLTLLYDHIENINGKDYYLYSLNGTDYTLDSYAFCVDVSSGELYKYTSSHELTLIK